MRVRAARAALLWGCLGAGLLAGCGARQHGLPLPAAGEATTGGHTSAPPASAAQLLGLGVAQLTLRLGPAAFRRTDGPTELLQYRSEACVLDVFVYRDADPDAGRVEHVEARTPAHVPMSADACLQTLRPAAPQRAG